MRDLIRRHASKMPLSSFSFSFLTFKTTCNGDAIDIINFPSFFYFPVICEASEMCPISCKPYSKPVSPRTITMRKLEWNEIFS